MFTPWPLKVDGRLCFTHQMCFEPFLGKKNFKKKLFLFTCYRVRTYSRWLSLMRVNHWSCMCTTQRQTLAVKSPSPPMEHGVGREGQWIWFLCVCVCGVCVCVCVCVCACNELQRGIWVWGYLNSLWFCKRLVILKTKVKVALCVCHNFDWPIPNLRKQLLQEICSKFTLWVFFSGFITQLYSSDLVHP